LEKTKRRKGTYRAKSHKAARGQLEKNGQAAGCKRDSRYYERGQILAMGGMRNVLRGIKGAGVSVIIGRGSILEGSLDNVPVSTGGGGEVTTSLNVNLMIRIGGKDRKPSVAVPGLLLNRGD